MLMSNSTLRVVAHLVALPDKIEDLKTLLLSLIEPTRQEPGCIQYELYQNQTDPTDFTFIEEWENAELLDAHLASSHIQNAIPKLTGIAAGPPDIRRYHLLA